MSYGKVKIEEGSDEPDGDYDPEADDYLSGEGGDENEQKKAVRMLDAHIAEVNLSGRNIMDIVGIGGRGKGTIGVHGIRKKNLDELGS